MPTSHPLQIIIRYAICTLLLAIGLRTWLVMGLIDPVVVQGRSMEPTFMPGQKLWIDRTAFAWRSPRRGEIVVAYNPADGSELCIKRVYGLPEELVSIKDGELLIDGRPRKKPKDSQSLKQIKFDPSPWKSQEWQLGLDEYFLLGDNLSISIDSRHWGPLRARFLLGRPLGVR